MHALTTRNNAVIISPKLCSGLQIKSISFPPRLPFWVDSRAEAVAESRVAELQVSTSPLVSLFCSFFSLLIFPPTGLLRACGGIPAESPVLFAESHEIARAHLQDGGVQSSTDSADRGFRVQSFWDRVRHSPVKVLLRSSSVFFFLLLARCLIASDRVLTKDEKLGNGTARGAFPLVLGRSLGAVRHSLAGILVRLVTSQQGVFRVALIIRRESPLFGLF